METPTFLYKPNFCAECGEKIDREAWHFWTSRSFCENCEPVFRFQRIVPVGLLGLVLAFGGIFLGQMGRSKTKPVMLVSEQHAPAEKVQAPVNKQVDAPPVSAATPNSNLDSTVAKNLPANSAAPAAPAVIETRSLKSAPEAVYTCGARTQKGTPCSRRVKAAGMRCWQHAGKPSMLETSK